MYNINIEKAEKYFSDYQDIILVDASDLDALEKPLKPEKVIEIIDHRKVHESDKYINAKVQIELVGSCATLIAEKYKNEDIAISKESAILLYTAVVSNTINFQGNITTNRDKEVAKWLKSKVEIPDNLIFDMFAHKSKISEPLKKVFDGDFKDFVSGSYKVGIAQLEIVEIGRFVKDRIEEIRKVLAEIRQERKLDYILLNCIDLYEVKSIIVVIDVETKQLIQLILDVKFKDMVGKFDQIIMRKELVALISEKLK